MFLSPPPPPVGLLGQEKKHVCKFGLKFPSFAAMVCSGQSGDHVTAHKLGVEVMTLAAIKILLGRWWKYIKS